MLSIIWIVLIFGGMFVAVVNGTMGIVSNEIVASSKDAISLCITMLGVVGMWNGVMKIAEKSGLVSKWADRIEPVITLLFPQLPKKSEAREYIAVNFIANILGLGWAATPAGLKAMKMLAYEEEKRGFWDHKTASSEMCTFLVINISSLQLIPINIIAYRSEYESQNPAFILAPALLATMISTLAGVTFCKIMLAADRYKKAK